MNNKKYELVKNDTIIVTDNRGFSHALYRIKALRSFNDIKKEI